MKMKNFSFKVFIIVLGFVCFKSFMVKAEAYASEGIYLIISSYNPDTKRVTDFISSFEKRLDATKFKGRVLIEDMACRDFEKEAGLWKSRVHDLIAKYNGKNLKAVILLGQEAWAAYTQQPDFNPNIPFFALYASENGIVLPDGELVGDPSYLDMMSKADSIGYAGGFINEYDVKRNIDLIKRFYPDVDNIAFVSDNTYGGVSLQQLVKREMKRYPDISLTLVDSRIYSTEEAKELIGKLPEHSALLIGTWRIDKDGLYYLSNSVAQLVAKNLTIPVFSLTSTGIGTIAIGGYIPRYNSNAAEIVKQIELFYSGHRDSVRFIENRGYYQFDKAKLNKIGVKEYQLPADSEIVSFEDARISKYRDYLFYISFATVFLGMFTALLFVLYSRNRKLKKNLEKNELELIQAKERAEESDKLKSAFLANMSHEIRTPLNAIVGFSNLLASEDLGEDEAKSFKSIIHKNSELLLSLINDILDISKLETGKAQFNFRRENLNSICIQALNTSSFGNDKEVIFKFEKGAEEFYINTDINKLTQVMINLLSNAKKFTDRGVITLKYTILPDERMVAISVSDTGPGIPENAFDRVFERFEKFNETKQGSGLGLAICKQIVTRMGGKIWVDKNYKEGARFIFTHPY